MAPLDHATEGPIHSSPEPRQRPVWRGQRHGDLTHQLVKLDGIAYLDGERVIAGEIGSPAAEELLTMTLSEIRDAVAA